MIVEVSVVINCENCHARFRAYLSPDQEKQYRLDRATIEQLVVDEEWLYEGNGHFCCTECRDAFLADIRRAAIDAVSLEQVRAEGAAAERERLKPIMIAVGAGSLVGGSGQIGATIAAWEGLARSFDKRKVERHGWASHFRRIAAAIRVAAEEANHSSKSIPSLESDILKLREALNKAISTIGNLQRESLGIGGDGLTHWSIRDELLENLNQVLDETERKS